MWVRERKRLPPHTFLTLPVHKISPDTARQGYLKKNFIEAKYDFIDRMMDFARLTGPSGLKPAKVLDVGCGIGGTSRYLAKASFWLTMWDVCIWWWRWWACEGVDGWLIACCIWIHPLVGPQKLGPSAAVEGITLSSEQVKRCVSVTSHYSTCMYGCPHTHLGSSS